MMTYVICCNAWHISRWHITVRNVYLYNYLFNIYTYTYIYIYIVYMSVLWWYMYEQTSSPSRDNQTRCGDLRWSRLQQLGPSFAVTGKRHWSMAISGTDWLEVPTIYKVYVRAMQEDIPPKKYCFIWCSTSILSWNSLDLIGIYITNNVGIMRIQWDTMGCWWNTGWNIHLLTIRCHQTWLANKYIIDMGIYINGT